MTEAWRKVWREGFAPLMPTHGLEELKYALEVDDLALIQGATTSPPPLACVADWECEGACPVGYCFWMGHDLKNVGDVDAFFGRACFDCDQALGEAGACRWFLNFFDDAPRDEVRRLLIPEVSRELERRRGLEKVNA